MEIRARQMVRQLFEGWRDRPLVQGAFRFLASYSSTPQSGREQRRMDCDYFAESGHFVPIYGRRRLDIVLMLLDQFVQYL